MARSVSNVEKVLECILGVLPEHSRPNISDYDSDEAAIAFTTFVDAHANSILDESAKMISRIATKRLITRVDSTGKQALESKDHGNLLMKDREFVKAIRQYTMSLACVDASEVCTASGDADAARRRLASVILSNRSAAWQSIGAFHQALQDADAAVLLDCKYAKAWYRRSQALEKISFSDLRTYYRECTAEVISAAVASEIAVALQVGFPTGSHSSDCVAFNVSSQIRSCFTQRLVYTAAAALPVTRVQEHTFGGRATYSANDDVIWPGTTVLSEEACVAVGLECCHEPTLWLTGRGTWRCDYCLKQVEVTEASALPYVIFMLDDGARAYCSVPCWVAAPHAGTPLLSQTIAVLGGDAALTLQLLDVLPGRLDNLRSHILMHSSAALLRLACFASIIRRSLVESGRKEVPSASNICETLCTVECNAHALKAVRLLADDGKLVSTISDDTYALGLFERGSLLNHSCQPSCTTRFTGRKMEVVAIRPIQPRDEITISYGPTTFTQASTQERQVDLLGRYHFLCHCIGCQVPVDSVQLLLDLRQVELVCCQLNPSALADDTTNVFSAVSNCAASLRCAAAWRLLGQRLDACAQQLAVLGATMLAARCASQSIDCLSHIDGSHPSLGYEYFKLATLYRQGGMWAEMEEAAAKASALLKLTCSDAHPDMKLVHSLSRLH
jgi:hypothetical protein